MSTEDNIAIAAVRILVGAVKRYHDTKSDAC
jgi:hypothetical protein